MCLRPLLPLLSMLSLSCSDAAAFCCGYSIEYQGGSKVSLLHSGEVIESYIVTGVHAERSLTVFELRAYGARDCRYRVASAPDRLSPALPLNQLDRLHPGLSAAVHNDREVPLNARSCLYSGS